MAANSIDDILKKSGITDLTGNHVLYRQDNTGNEFFMCGNLSKQAAEYLVKYYTDLGHHQSYSTEIAKNNILEILPPR